jgi:hypothetical protein
MTSLASKMAVPFFDKLAAFLYNDRVLIVPATVWLQKNAIIN